MGKTASNNLIKQTCVRDELMVRFARLMWERHRARLYLFGSRARDTAREESDYDVVAVADAFADQSRFRRCLDRYQLWHAAGGFRQSLDLHCYTPQEFRAELKGLGYLAHVHERGELKRVSRASSRRKATGGQVPQ